jgi:hypothetical protein
LKTRRYTCRRKLPLNFNTISGIARMVTRGSAARGRTASESTARETGESSARQIDQKHTSIPRSHVVTCKICRRSNASSPGNCSTRGASIRAEVRAELLRRERPHPSPTIDSYTRQSVSYAEFTQKNRRILVGSIGLVRGWLEGWPGCTGSAEDVV